MAKVQNAVKVPIHYILMFLTVVVIVLLRVFIPKRVLYTYSVFCVALFCCMKSISEKKGEEKKWCAFWFVFAFAQYLPSCLDHLKYYSFAKFLALLYLAVCDDCQFIVELFDVVYGWMEGLLKKYTEKYCQKPEEKSE